MDAALSPIHLILDQAFNDGNLPVVDELVSADSVNRLSNWGMPANRLGLKQMIAGLRNAFPDLQCTIEDEIQADEKVAVRWRMQGTHQGAFFGHLPTGREVAVQGFFFARTADNQIVESWIILDQMSVLQQIGVVPR